MKKQAILVGFLASVFVFVAAGASFAGERRGHRPRHNQWEGRHLKAPHAPRHKAPGYQARNHRPDYQGRSNYPRHRYNERGTHHRPRYSDRGPNSGTRPSYRHGWRAQPSTHHRPTYSGHRSGVRDHRDRRPAGADYRRPHNGQGHDRQPAFGRSHDTDRDRRNASNWQPRHDQSGGRPDGDGSAMDRGSRRGGRDQDLIEDSGPDSENTGSRRGERGGAGRQRGAI